jgi:ABC-2 type transport system permease protein
MIGREINMERRREVHHYMLSLPMTRLELAIGRVLSGGLRGMMYMSPLLLTCFIFVGFPTVPQLFLILAVLFMLAVGISGLSISIAVSTSSLEKFITARGAVYYALFFCSTVFYPLTVIQTAGAVLGTIAQLNPLSGASDLIRTLLMPNLPSAQSFSNYSILYVAVFSAVFTFTAAFAYMKVLERNA